MLELSILSALFYQVSRVFGYAPNYQNWRGYRLLQLKSSSILLLLSVILSQINSDSWPDASCASQQDSGLKRAPGYKEVLQQTIQWILFSKNAIINTEEVFSDFTNTPLFLKVGVSPFSQQILFVMVVG